MANHDQHSRHVYIMIILLFSIITIIYLTLLPETCNDNSSTPARESDDTSRMNWATRIWWKPSIYYIYFFKYYFRIELLTHGLFQIINNKMARTIIIIRIITFTQQRPARMLETFHRPHAMTRLEWPTGDKNTLFLKTSSSSCSDKVKQNTFSRLQHTHLRVII